MIVSAINPIKKTATRYINNTKRNKMIHFNIEHESKPKLKGANLKNVIAYATRFEGADLSGANLSGADLLKSFFDGALIDGTDFSDAVLDLKQQKALCQRATGKTAESLQCNAINDSYVPASEGQNKVNPGVGS